MVELAQAFIDIMAWFLVPFACVVVVSWIVSIFRGLK